MTKWGMHLTAPTPIYCFYHQIKMPLYFIAPRFKALIRRAIRECDRKRHPSECFTTTLYLVLGAVKCIPH